MDKFLILNCVEANRTCLIYQSVVDGSFAYLNNKFSCHWYGNLPSIMVLTEFNAHILLGLATNDTGKRTVTFPNLLSQFW